MPRVWCLLNLSGRRWLIIYFTDASNLILYHSTDYCSVSCLVELQNSMINSMGVKLSWSATHLSRTVNLIWPGFQTVHVFIGQHMRWLLGWVHSCLNCQESDILKHVWLQFVNNLITHEKNQEESWNLLKLGHLHALYILYTAIICPIPHFCFWTIRESNWRKMAWMWLRRHLCWCCL